METKRWYERNHIKHMGKIRIGRKQTFKKLGLNTFKAIHGITSIFVVKLIAYSYIYNFITICVTKNFWHIISSYNFIMICVTKNFWQSFNPNKLKKHFSLVFYSTSSFQRTDLLEVEENSEKIKYLVFFQVF